MRRKFRTVNPTQQGVSWVPGARPLRLSIGGLAGQLPLAVDRLGGDHHQAGLMDVLCRQLRIRGGPRTAVERQGERLLQNASEVSGS